MVNLLTLKRFIISLSIPVNIDDSKICPGNQFDVGACLGDSGGPLVSLEKADDNLCK